MMVWVCLTSSCTRAGLAGIYDVRSVTLNQVSGVVCWRIVANRKICRRHWVSLPPHHSWTAYIEPTFWDKFFFFLQRNLSSWYSLTCPNTGWQPVLGAHQHYFYSLGHPTSSWLTDIRSSNYSLWRFLLAVTFSLFIFGNQVLLEIILRTRLTLELSYPLLDLRAQRSNSSWLFGLGSPSK